MPIIIVSPLTQSGDILQKVLNIILSQKENVKLNSMKTCATLCSVKKIHGYYYFIITSLGSLNHSCNILVIIFEILSFKTIKELAMTSYFIYNKQVALMST